MRTTPEPKDKLDAMPATAPAAGEVMVNGPEDNVPGWQSIGWPSVEGEVRRLRQRIFTAAQAGDLKRVRNLQKLMLRSRANTLVSVRRVTEVRAARAAQVKLPVSGSSRAMAAATWRPSASVVTWFWDRRAAPRGADGAGA
jgi:hypothetical protein